MTDSGHTHHEMGLHKRLELRHVEIVRIAVDELSAPQMGRDACSVR